MTSALMVSPLASARPRGIPTGAGYTVLLLAHVAAAVIGFGALWLTGLQAQRARAGPSGPKAAAVRRYFRPGINWAARAVYLVPVFGFALLAASGGAFRVSDPFVVSGLAMWVVAAGLAEGVVWPAERRIQNAVTERWVAAGHDSAGRDSAGREVVARDAGDGEPFRRECTRVIAATWLVTALFAASVVVMVVKP